MSMVVTLLSPTEAQRLTQRIKLTASGVRDGLFKLRNLVEEAKHSNAWQVLGYPSWTAYLADTLADEPMRLARDERQELVGYLSGEGLSTRAIAPIVGATKSQVARDIAASPVPNGTPASAPFPAVEIDADPDTGEVIEDAEIVEEPEAPTPQPRKVTGLDGKTYVAPLPKPREDTAEQDNAEQASKALGKALITLSAMKHQAHRERMITRWWPMGNDAVPPDWKALFEPNAIRDIASWLMKLATELENSR